MEPIEVEGFGYPFNVEQRIKKKATSTIPLEKEIF